jgi:hypothetical protein
MFVCGKQQTARQGGGEERKQVKGEDQPGGRGGMQHEVQGGEEKRSLHDSSPAGSPGRTSATKRWVPCRPCPASPAAGAREVQGRWVRSNTAQSLPAAPALAQPGQLSGSHHSGTKHSA